LKSTCPVSILPSYNSCLEFLDAWNSRIPGHPLFVFLDTGFWTNFLDTHNSANIFGSIEGKAIRPEEARYNMGLARSSYVNDSEVGVYHCFTRCVRRAFLSGFDRETGRDYSHRKLWIVNRLRYLAGIFAIEVCAYAVMENHYHTVLRTRPDIVQTWSDREVAWRWLTLFPNYSRDKEPGEGPTEQQISALAGNAERIIELRKRLSSISWFMGRLNEYVARAANREEDVKGRYWESRFRCRPLLDGASIAACMVYVDLNPIRAGLAESCEQSDYTSIQERMRVWGTENSANGGRNEGGSTSMEESRCRDTQDESAAWLCSIEGTGWRDGILDMTEKQYIDLVNESSRLVRGGKSGDMDAEFREILERMGIKAEAWGDTVSSFASRFPFAAGLISSLRKMAGRWGRQWLKGYASARIAFSETPL
jgi:REP element-mobilizing transposase RayT